MVRPLPAQPGEVPTQEQLEWELNDADVDGATISAAQCAQIAKYLLERYKIRRRFARKWRSTTIDHWGTCDDGTALSVWYGGGDRWRWEAWVEGRPNPDEPSATGDAPDRDAAKRAAEAYDAAAR